MLLGYRPVLDKGPVAKSTCRIITINIIYFQNKSWKKNLENEEEEKKIKCKKCKKNIKKILKQLNISKRLKR